MKTADYLSQLERALKGINPSQVEEVAGILIRARAAGSWIYVFGNGDSASNATHIAADLAKGTARPGKQRFRILSLNQNIPLMTAWANDTSYDMVFKEQLENLLKPGDIVIGISTSGNSPNVLRAIEFASKAGATTIALAACGGGKLAKAAGKAIVADTDNVEIAEDMHWVVGHLLKVRIIELDSKEG